MSILPYQLDPEYSSSEEIEDHVSDSEEEEIGDLELPSGENRATHTSCACVKDVLSCRLKWICIFIRGYRLAEDNTNSKVRACEMRQCQFR